MKKIELLLLSIVFITSVNFAQNSKTKAGHTNQNKFKQLKELLPTPNLQRTASGAPGLKYTQQKVDYTMDIILDDTNTRIYGGSLLSPRSISAHSIANVGRNPGSSAQHLGTMSHKSSGHPSSTPPSPGRRSDRG